jgi:hypothetical protein
MGATAPANGNWTSEVPRALPVRLEADVSGHERALVCSQQDAEVFPLSGEIAHESMRRMDRGPAPRGRAALSHTAF